MMSASQARRRVAEADSGVPLSNVAEGVRWSVYKINDELDGVHR